MFVLQAVWNDQLKAYRVDMYFGSGLAAVGYILGGT
jgi:hypothetical protein